MPPMIRVHGVGGHPHPAPRTATVLLSRKAAHARSQAVNNSLRQLTRLVNKPTSQFQRKQLPYVARLIQCKEDNLAINAGRVAALRQLDVVGNGRRPAHGAPHVLRKYLLPRLQRSRPQFWVTVTNYCKPGVAHVVYRRRRLLHGAEQNLRQTSICLARPNRPHQTAHKAVVV